MAELWLVLKFEYQRNVFKKSFLITLFSVPIMIALIVGMGLFLESRGDEGRPVGIVDQADLLPELAVPSQLQAAWATEYTQPVEFIFYLTEEAARSALEAGEAQAYFLLPEHYLHSRKVEVVYLQEPGDAAWMQFYDLVRAGWLEEQPSETAARVPASSGPTFGLLMPLFIALAVLAMLIICSGYTANAVADEKENRTMEVLVTATSPGQLIGGKVLGITAISLTLMACWAGVTGLGILIARQVGVAWFADLSMDWRGVLATLAIAIPAYVLATALMTAIGSMVSTTQEGQSLSGIFFALHFLPLYVSIAYLNDPHNPLAVALSLLPFTSLASVAMRNLFSVVPTWQVVVSVAVQILCAWGAIWLAGRAFRLGMLHYGQRLRFRRVLVDAKKGVGGSHG